MSSRMTRKTRMRALLIGAIARGATAAYASRPSGAGSPQTPRGWSYNIKTVSACPRATG